MDDRRATLMRALQLLEADIAHRQEIIDALREAAGVLHETLGSFSYAEMTLLEVCEYLGVARTSIGRYMAGRVPAGKPPFPSHVNLKGRTKIFSRDDIVKWNTTII